MTETEMLSEEQVREIEALAAKVPDGPWFTANDDADDVPEHRRSGLALVETGRSADWWIARLCEWHTARFIAESKTNIDALCQTVRVLRQWKAEALPLLTRYDNLAETFGGKLGSSKVNNLERGVTALREQLAQVEKERNDLRNENRQLRQRIPRRLENP